MILYYNSKEMKYCFVLSVIPVSDSGEAEASLAFERQRFSLIRGFVPVSLHKNHLQGSRAFWILFGGTKSIGKKLNLKEELF
jgi:hypothetical protein